MASVRTIFGGDDGTRTDSADALRRAASPRRLTADGFRIADRRAASVARGRLEPEAPAVTRDDYVFELGNRPPDFIKIDVNGAELRVLQGATRLIRERPPKVLVEVRTRTQSDVLEFMLDAGYQHHNLTAERQARAHLYNIVFVPRPSVGPS